MDLLALFGILSGILGIIIFFSARFLWIPTGKNDFSAIIKISQNKGKIKIVIIVFSVIFTMWLIVAAKLLFDLFS